MLSFIELLNAQFEDLARQSSGGENILMQNRYVGERTLAFTRD